MFPILLLLATGLPAPQAVPPTRPAPPIFQALDLNHDGVIDADELAQASTSLKRLDRNGDGRLTPDEYRPARPEGVRAPRPSGPQGSEAEVPPEDAAPPEAASAGPRPPRPLIDTALDENGDEVIDASEIARAPLLLKKLDLNGDGRLSLEECLPKRQARSKEHAPQG